MANRFGTYLLGLSILLLTAACGRGAGSQLAPASGGTLAWPPPAPSRTASDDSPYFHGMDYTQGGGNLTVLGTTVQLVSPAGSSAWVIYSLQGFGPGSDLDKFKLDYTVTPGAPDNGTKLYVGLANFAQGRWEWLDASPPSATIDLADFSPYYSPSGSVHLACVLAGNGSARISGVRFYRVGPGADVPVPTNVQATPLPGKIQLNWDAVPYVDGYNIYRSTVDDFATARKLNAGPLSGASYLNSSVVKNTEYFYWVTAIRGLESAPSVPADVTAYDTTILPPTNLQVIADVGKVTLSWDPPPNATHYKVYRSQYADFFNAVSFDAPTPQYVNNDITPVQTMYYYRVTGIGPVEEGSPTPAVDIFVPAADLPAPLNFQIDAARTDSDYATTQWVYSGTPAGFNIYFHRKPAFALDVDVVRNASAIAGTAREDTEFGLPADGTTLYCRICARDGLGRLGRMTDAIAFTNHRGFIFAPQVNLGTNGAAPMATATDGNKIAVVYNNSGSLRLASRDTSGSWTADQDIGLNASYGTYADIAYGGGSYIVGAQQAAAGDCWISIGSPGSSWSSLKIHGDGGTGPGHQVSGLFVACAASDTEYSVAHYYSDTHQVLVQTKLLPSGTWSSGTVARTYNGTPKLSLAYNAGDLGLLVSEASAGNLMLGWRSDSYATIAPINTVPGDGIYDEPHFFNLGGTLETTALDANAPGLYTYAQNGSAWDRSAMFSSFGQMSKLGLASGGGKMLITFFCNDINRWMYAYYDGTEWAYGSVVTNPETPQLDLKPAMLVSGDPHIVFNNGSANLFAAHGFLQ